MYSSLIPVLALLATATNALQLGPLPVFRQLEFVTHHEPLEASVGSSSTSPSYKAYNISVPVDHFHNDTRYAPHTDETFNLRYWFDAQYYRAGGPVIVIAAGEADATARIPFLEKGIVARLAERYHGIGVILEHRYYGTSYPEKAVEELTPESIRFLSTDQALADYAYFAKNVQFPGLEHLDLTAGKTPWLAYGGSYAGAFVAFLRKLYPDVYYGAVSSSGVTQAIEDYWQYMEPIRKFAPATCVAAMETFTDIIDRVLIDHGKNRTLGRQLQAAFGVKGKSLPMKNVDFVSLLVNPLGLFQERNWDPNVGSPGFRDYCRNITSAQLLYPDTAASSSVMKDVISTTGYDATNKTLVTNLLNFAGYTNLTTTFQLSAKKSRDSKTKGLPRSASTSWNYQVCTEWGFFMTGASVPADIPPLMSRLIDLEYASMACPQDFNITTPPDTSIINKHGGHHFSFPRVAIIDGLADPWREATPHADSAPARTSTDAEPFILIDVPEKDVWDHMRGGVHHWDQNGLSTKDLQEGSKVPRAISEVHEEVLRFVGVWLSAWKNGAVASEQKVLSS